jgi:hypothetical protein
MFGLVIALEGLRGWSEGSVMVYLKGRTPFVATPLATPSFGFMVLCFYTRVHCRRHSLMRSGGLVGMADRLFVFHKEAQGYY